MSRTDYITKAKKLTSCVKFFVPRVVIKGGALENNYMIWQAGKHTKTQCDTGDY